eukprot:s3147_g2.t1
MELYGAGESDDEEDEGSEELEPEVAASALAVRTDAAVGGLKVGGHEVTTEDLALITLKAEVIQESFEEVGTWDVRALARNLRDKFASVALDMELSDVDKASRSEAIGQAILALGGKESSKPDKLLSTPSADGPVMSPTTRGAVSLREVGGAGLARYATGGGDSPLRAKVAALEMELEALKKGSDGSVAGGGGFGSSDQGAARSPGWKDWYD